MFATLNIGTDYLKIFLDNSLEGIYDKDDNYHGFAICSPWDYLFLYSHNLTAHTANNFTVGINAVTDQDYDNEGIALRNFFLHVDTCDISCATCYGPTNVRKYFIFTAFVFKI